ncbi:MAG: ferritin-like domain-containing protein [Bacteroidota bacterium]
MNLSNIINEIAKTDDEFFEKTSQRRDVIRKITRTAALTALPLALGGMFQKAYGKTTDVIIDTLNFALALEHLEAEFYKMVITTSSALVQATGGTAALNALTTIRDHEIAHVNFLTTAIQGAGGVAALKGNYDFTAGGTFADVFTNYDTLLAVAQAFEDTGVRAYKGQAGNLMGNNDILTAALNIHSVEARHASHIRQMRKARGASVKPWITLNQSGIASTAVQPIYNGEENTLQATLQITGINGTAVNANAASEAFDEPLDKAAVLAIVDPFIL